MHAQALRGPYGPLVVIAAAVALGVAAYVVNRDDSARLPRRRPGGRTRPGPDRGSGDACGGGRSADGTGGGAGPADATPGEARSFDVVRVAPDGSAVVAGTAAPGREVTVYAGSGRWRRRRPTPTALRRHLRREPSAEPRR